MIDSRLLEILVCPVSQGPLVFRRDVGELWSPRGGLAYPVHDGVPVLLEEEARALTEEERASLAT